VDQRVASTQGARKNGKFKAVSTAPSFNKTPVGNSTPPLPYPVMQDLGSSAGTVATVKFNGDPAYVLDQTTQPSCKGDAPGSCNGVKSGTVGGEVKPVKGSSTVRVGGKPIIRDGDPCTLNKGNCPGIYVTAPAPPAPIESGAPSASSNPPVTPETPAEKSMWSSVAHGVLGVASFVPGLSVVTGALDAGLYAAEGDFAEAALAAASMIPGGKVATTAGKLVKGAAKMKAAKSAHEAEQIAANAKRAAEASKALKAKEAAKVSKGNDGAKVTGKGKKKKKDKPSDCCPKDKGPGGKSVKSRHPIHFGTGEEILDQTDFVVEGPIPLIWTRTYRSGSECEDWGLLGARWATPFTSSVSLTPRGVVYHEDSGRALRLPFLALGQELDKRDEGFVLRRDSDTQFSLTWRDGSTDTFVRGPDSGLPHGYDGVNAMRAPRAPVPTERYYLSRSAGRDGKGVSIERWHEAKPGEVLLRLRTDSGQIVEALRDEQQLVSPNPNANPPPVEIPRIGRIEEVRADGSRVCHVSYRYQVEPGPGSPTASALTLAQAAFEKLPQRVNLIAQSNLAGETRTYSYQHHLLQKYTNYSGFAHGLKWISLAALRARWNDSALSDEKRAQQHPITLHNSYQARAIQTTTADGNDEVHVAYIDEDTTRVTEADGGILEYSFNEQWLVTDVRRIPANGGPAQSLGRREWDSDGMLVGEVDATGNTTRYTYDGAGNLASITDAKGQTTRIEYDGHNQPIAVTDALGYVTRNSFEDAGRILATTDALGQRTSHEYDAQGRLVTITDARGGSKKLSYDAAGRLSSYTDCSNYTSRYGYDAQGRLIKVTDALGNTSGYEYDALGRLKVVTHPDKTRETYTYDAEGNLSAHTDPKGQITRYRYNGHDLPIKRIDPKGQTLEYRYDRALRLVELINGNGESYRFNYDAESRLVSETGFDGKTTMYQYDAAGQLVGSTCQGVKTEFVRDALGLLTDKVNPDGLVRYAYDALGRLVAVATPQAEHRFGFDPIGQLIDERSAYTLNLPGLPGAPVVRTAAFTLTHSYDALGNRLQTTLPNGRRVDTLRYGSGHWHGTLWQERSLVDLERDHLHRETQRDIGAGPGKDRLRATRSYDPQSRLTAITLNKGKQRLRDRRYTYDETGNLTQITDLDRGDTRYRYDPLGQLLAAIQPNLSETFAFDPAGNILDTGKAARQTPSSLNGYADLTEQPVPNGAPPQLIRIKGNLLHQYMGYTYDYDVQGNTVSKRLQPTASANEASVLDLAYDADNRLIKATRTWPTARQVAHYQYDAFGRRIAKQVIEHKWAAGQNPNTAKEHSRRTTLFVWDGDVLVQEIQPDKTVSYVYEPDSFVPLARVESREGITIYAGENLYLAPPLAWNWPTDPTDPFAHVNAWRENVHAQKEAQHQEAWQQRQDKAKTAVTGDRIHYYQCDHLGTPLELVDAQGDAVWSAQYKAWGGILRYERLEVEQPLRFQGQYEDAETGLYYNRHRYYDPDSARYVTQDPIGLLGGENLYRYAPNPTAWIDVLGLKCYRTLYRGGPDSTKALKSHGANDTGYAGASENIRNGNMHTMLKNHAIDSKAFKSPLISLTTDIRVARYFATAGGTRTGVVYKLRIPCGDVVKNKHNNLGVPAGPNGELISESEWALKRPYIRPNEIIRKILI